MPTAARILLTAIALHVCASAADRTAAIPPGFPASWGTNDNKAVVAYYGTTTVSPTNQEFAAALNALPSLHLRAKMDDFFGADRGIYSHPRETGSNWERPASIELVRNGNSVFKIDCGIRIQGGWNRRPDESPKHAFRIVFKKRYGPGKLHASLFDGAKPQVFNELILRAGCNNTWLHWSGEERRRGDYIRDQWMRDTYRAMGHPSARGEFVHLFLNGYYWGIYNLTERPGPDFAAAHFGGRAEDYDSRNADNILSGDTQAWDKMLALANAGVKSDENYQSMAALLDIPAFIDFMLLNLYGGNADWDASSNWYAARHRDHGQFHFFIWDGERTLEDPKANTLAADDDQSPTRLFHKLRENETFRKLFAERTAIHLKGTLAPEAAAQRWRQLAETLRIPITAEAARWGAYRHDVHPYKTGPYEIYTRETHWLPEINRVLKEFFPTRNAALLEIFQKSGFEVLQPRSRRNVANLPTSP